MPQSADHVHSDQPLTPVPFDRERGDALAPASTLKFIWNHPLMSRSRLVGLRRYVCWQLATRMLDSPVIVPFVNGTSLVIKPRLQGAVGNYYTGLRDYEDMAFVLHALAPADTFVDIGASIGSYSVCAASVGSEVLAVEPVPATHHDLVWNIALNGFGTVIRDKQVGVGAEPGVLRFTTNQGSGNHVAVGNDDSKAIECPVSTLDDIVGETSPRIIKIDVEGFETEVIAGGRRALKSDALWAVVIEMNGLGTRYGFNDEALHNELAAYGFTPVGYDPSRRRLESLDGPNDAGNTIYVRQQRGLTRRLEHAPPFTVAKQWI